MDTIIPKALKRGDKIAFISPSARLNDILSTPLARGKACLESLGFRVQIIFSSQVTATIAESIRVRCEEIHAAFRDNTITAIICTIGGAHANELLPFLNYSLIRSNPKIFVGYSDTTFLHYAIQSRTGLRTFYGPSILTDFSDFPKPMQFTIDHFLRVLTEAGMPVGPLPRSPICSKGHSDFLFSNEMPDKPREIVDSPSWRWLRRGRATGNLYGGTLPCVVRLQGTPYAPASWKDKILFLESAMGDNMQLPYSVSQFRNNLVDLALSGILHEIRGLVVGRGYKYDAHMQDELANVIEEVFDVIVGRSREEQLPILMNVDFGHTSPFLTLPINALVRLDYDIDDFSVIEPGTRA
ncbi:putative carboxypeptidase [Penicillium rolfsii]|nr:putative carboxypeptidase [Penicillium rolfsii]